MNEQQGQTSWNAVKIISRGILAIQVIGAIYYITVGPDIFCHHTQRWYAFVVSPTVVALLMLEIGFVAIVVAAIAGAYRFCVGLTLVGIGYFMFGFWITFILRFFYPECHCP